jgi:hypothetical protein
VSRSHWQSIADAAIKFVDNEVVPLKRANRELVDDSPCQSWLVR